MLSVRKIILILTSLANSLFLIDFYRLFLSLLGPQFVFLPTAASVHLCLSTILASLSFTKCWMIRFSSSFRYGFKKSFLKIEQILAKILAKILNSSFRNNLNDIKLKLLFVKISKQLLMLKLKSLVYLLNHQQAQLERFDF